ncbi:MAG: rhodanese-like domain-containing protein [Gammaproteobacteria bacterium]
MRGFREIDVNELCGWLGNCGDGEPPPRLIDVRSPGETARGVLPSAELVPLAVLPVCSDDLAGSGPLVFYCQSGARSAQACAFMAERGHDKVYSLRGGIMAWLQGGQPVTQSPQDA